MKNIWKKIYHILYAAKIIHLIFFIRIAEVENVFFSAFVFIWNLSTQSFAPYKLIQGIISFS